MTSLMQLKAANEARLGEEKRTVDRKRNLLTLILRYLVDSGYVDASERLQSEGGASLSKVDVADNMNLLVILQEFEEYYEMKFGSKPKLTRKLTTDQTAEKRKELRRGGSGRSGGSRGSRPPRSKGAAAAASGAGEESPREGGAGDMSDLSVGGSKAPTKALRAGDVGKSSSKGDESDASDYYEERVLKPLPAYEGNPQLRELAAIVSRDIYQRNPNVRWTDVVELPDPKRLLKEAVVMPVKYPQLFTGMLTPWKGILLFGPPGTGKTMLARAVATECRTTFFNISASSIVSKWRGDSEKLVRMLFELARYHAPSTIFIDELDAIMGQRGSEGGAEHEASRRMKTELLIQMDGLNKTDDLVFLLAASNLPWELDVAMLRRLEKRVLVPLPGAKARELMIRKRLPPGPDTSPDLDYASLAAKTEGFSGSDIQLLCKETAMQPLRRLMARLESEEGSTSAEVVRLEPVTNEDAESALSVTRPSAHLYADKYVAWQKEFGSR